MKLKCANCYEEFEGSISKDGYGWHSSCPFCKCTFDVELPLDLDVILSSDLIVMAFAKSEEEYFTNAIEDSCLISIYTFNTVDKFLKAWKEKSKDPDSMWYFVYYKNECICSGVCDPDDIEIFNDVFNVKSSEEKLKNNVYTTYAANTDMTFIMVDTYNNENLKSTECLGWYYGTPDSKINSDYIGKLKAEY